ncbi:MAG: (2Fe-2S)-binding protein [Firmicutes bacterium]|nr:(2Fe-2S)-binding protein [Bacillota bacterium]
MNDIKGEERVSYTLTVNGTDYALSNLEPRWLLSDVLRDILRLTGTHVGCEHGVCGACTVLMDGRPTRSCLMLAVQAEGHAIETVESLAHDGQLSPLQEAFWNEHALQCGFCTPGMLMTAEYLLRRGSAFSRPEIRQHLSGNLCRCTGYQNIVNAIERAMRATAAEGPETCGD